MRNFQVLIVSAVEICKQCLQTASILGDLVPQRPHRAPLYSTDDFRLAGRLGSSRPSADESSCLWPPLVIVIMVSTLFSLFC